MQVQQLLKLAAARLAAAGIDSSSLEAELLLQDCLGVSRSGFFLILDQQIEVAIEKRFQTFLERRCLREPLQYIVGHCEFWSLDFALSPAVLIPRPETEFLLEHVFSVLSRTTEVLSGKILDLCTGSGIIAVILAREFPDCEIHAVDYSFQALKVAKENFIQHGLSQRIYIHCADLLTGLTLHQKFDVIVSNPPYVKSTDIPDLEPEVCVWEPELALSGGPSGMDVIERICAEAARHLTHGGWLFLEIGADIEEAVLKVFITSNGYEQIRVVPDWAGKPRVLQARFVG